MLGCCRRQFHDEVHQTVRASVAETGGEQHRENFVLANGVVQRRDQVLLGNCALVEEFFHERVVAFGNHLDQLFVGLLGGGFHVVGDLAFLALAVSAQFVGVGLHADQVHYA